MALIMCLVNVIFLATLELTLIKGTKGLLCYRCDSVNQGDTCEANPASKYIRNYGDEEKCLTFEEVNTQYLALQKEMDGEWYFSVLNGDHGIPIQILRSSLASGDANHANGPFIHADRDIACLFVRSIFHHDLDEDETLRLHPSFILWFRKCVQLPAMDTYPICGEGNIYKGHVELCICKEDRCNMDKVSHLPHINALNSLPGPVAREAVVIGHHHPSKSRAVRKCFYSLSSIITLVIIKSAITFFLN